MTDDRAKAHAEARSLRREIKRDKGRASAARARVKMNRRKLEELEQRYGIRREEGPATPHTARKEHSDRDSHTTEGR